jgi:hypothetical protein
MQPRRAARRWSLRLDADECRRSISSADRGACAFRCIGPGGGKIDELAASTARETRSVASPDADSDADTDSRSGVGTLRLSRAKAIACRCERCLDAVGGHEVLVGGRRNVDATATSIRRSGQRRR